uniref:Uncharacterized protein n=1 Tax=Corethron hystrix TaxID=216773 RepID=A0A7S1BWQ1_9STRA
MYLVAAACAHAVREMGLELLDGKLEDEDKYWIETVVLDICAQVSVEEDEDSNIKISHSKDDEEGEPKKDSNTNTSHSEDDEEGEPKEDSGTNTSLPQSDGHSVDNKESKPKEDSDTNTSLPQSSVLSTALYMAVLLSSLTGRHHLASLLLQYGYTSPNQSVARIHPNLWQAAHKSQVPPMTTPTPQHASFRPVLFPDAVSPALHRTLRWAFRPSSPYWLQSGYARGTYYSYWSDLDPPRPPPPAGSVRADHAVAHYVASFLIPRLRATLGPAAADSVRGYEWWVHTRPVGGANLGHQLHFDTDEALLEQEAPVRRRDEGDQNAKIDTRSVRYPLCSTVLYLTEDKEEEEEEDSNKGTGGGAGATLIFDQVAESETDGTMAWVGIPRARHLLMFPGNLLHGVLPCSHRSGDAPQKGPRKQDPSEDVEKNAPHRLTLMVGLWDRNVPARIRDRKLYGPSGPLPPDTPEHSWIRGIMGKGNCVDDSGKKEEGDNNHDANGEMGTEASGCSLSSPSSSSLEMQEGSQLSYPCYVPENSVPLEDSCQELPAISPAWEVLHAAAAGKDHNNDDGSKEDAFKKRIESFRDADRETLCHLLLRKLHGTASTMEAGETNDGCCVALPTCGINQRFFVKGSPGCFKRMLFEK